MKILFAFPVSNIPLSGEANTVYNWSKAAIRFGLDVTNVKLCQSAPRRLDFDIVHFVYGMDGVSAVPMLTKFKMQRYKLINSYHSNFLPRSNFLFRPLLFDAITVPSERMLKVFSEKIGLPKEKWIIPPCVDEKHFSPRNKSKIRETLGLPQEKLIVFTAGHFKPGRQITSLIKIIRELNHERKNIHLIIGWTGQGDREYVKKIFLIAQNNPRITIIPPTDKINLYYNAADIYVLTANSNHVIETPLSLLEALSSGTPSIAFDVNATSEIINDGNNGYIIKKNDFTEIKNKLNFLADSEDVLKKFSVNSRNTIVNKYSYAKIGSQLSNLYNKVWS
ncbi:MAG: glycosyltransferase family 4 protein [Clostridiales bacterium]|nr:glycosyltransferase family 4 protein [Clostridiales bacterium]